MAVLLATSLSRRLQSAIRTIPVQTASAALLAASSAGMLLVFQGTTPLSLVVASGALSGVASALYYASLASMLLRSQPAQALTASLIAYLLSTVFSCFAKAAWGGGGIALISGLPLASLTCFLLGSFASGRRAKKGSLEAKSLAIAHEAPSEDTTASSATAPERKRFFAVDGSLLRFALCVGGIAFVNELVRTVNLTLHGEVATSVNASSYLLEATLVTVGIAAICYAFGHDKDARAITASYRGTIFFTIFALLLPLTSADPTTTTIVFFAIHLAAYGCFGFFWWLVAVRVGSSVPERGLRLFLWSFACQAAASLAGIAGGELALALLGSRPVVTIVIMLAVALLLLSYLVIFPESQLARLVRPVEAKEGGSFVEACHAAADRFGLSKRESEIMVMLAKGRDAAYICEQLVISKSTVSMHRQHIYRKLDIHSQQELIDLIDTIKQELRAK